MWSGSEEVATVVGLERRKEGRKEDFLGEVK
jgi:hypothetical protein